MPWRLEAIDECDVSLFVISRAARRVDLKVLSNESQSK